MSSFEDRLFADLMREHSAVLAEPDSPPLRRGARPVWAVAGAVAVAGLTAAGIGLVTGGTPAYAVSRGADGTVTVSVRKISGVAGANAELRRMGVPVVAVPVRKGCTAQVREDRHLPSPVYATSPSTSEDQRNATFTLQLEHLPAGDTVVLGTQTLSDGAVVLALTVVIGPAPACLPKLNLHTEYHSK